MSNEKEVTPTEGKEASSDLVRKLAEFRERLSQLSDAEALNTETSCDDEIKDEERFFEKGQRDYEQEIKDAELVSLKQDIDLRRKFAWAGYWMNIGWLVAILLIIVSAGFHFYRFGLPDSVLLALIGTTTANVLGVLYIVMRYLFDTKFKH
jgi:hypothetical protein